MSCSHRWLSRCACVHSVIVSTCASSPASYALQVAHELLPRWRECVPDRHIAIAVVSGNVPAVCQRRASLLVSDLYVNSAVDAQQQLAIAKLIASGSGGLHCMWCSVATLEALRIRVGCEHRVLNALQAPLPLPKPDTIWRRILAGEPDSCFVPSAVRLRLAAAEDASAASSGARKRRAHEMEAASSAASPAALTITGAGAGAGAGALQGHGAAAAEDDDDIDDYTFAQLVAQGAFSEPGAKRARVGVPPNEVVMSAIHNANWCLATLEDQHSPEEAISSAVAAMLQARADVTSLSPAELAPDIRLLGAVERFSEVAAGLISLQEEAAGAAAGPINPAVEECLAAVLAVIKHAETAAALPSAA